VKKGRTSGYHGRSFASHEHGGTPDDLMQRITATMAAGGWLDVFDPCPNAPTFDGLAQEWPDDQPVFVNPPYTRGKINRWVEKCSEEAMKHPDRPIILLIPSYTDTAYFHRWILNHEGEIGIHWIAGRLKFKGYERSAAFPSVLICYNLNPEFQAEFVPAWCREAEIKGSS
jgi:hypothetical protein